MGAAPRRLGEMQDSLAIPHVHGDEGVAAMGFAEVAYEIAAINTESP